VEYTPVNRNPVEYQNSAIAELIGRKDANSVALRAMLHNGGEEEERRRIERYEREHERRRTKAMSIREFCENNDISPSTYFNLKKRGLGPREMAVGNRITISPEAEADWRVEREQAARRLRSTMEAE
jgi:3-methyladenine DNA glycosylase Mpg